METGAPLASQFATPVAAVAAYVNDTLGAAAEDWLPGRIQVISSTAREWPGWHGWSVPLWGIGRGESAVVSTTKQLASPIRAVVGVADNPRSAVASPFPERMLDVVRGLYPAANLRIGRLLYCDRVAPLDGASSMWSVVRFSRSMAAERGHWLAQLDWDGFVVLDARGSVASSCGIKIKHPAVWELAVGTEPAYRGQGMAKAVVAAATQAVLDAGRVPIYVHDLSNAASSQVARTVGYRWFGTEVSCDFHPASRPLA